MSLLTPDRLVVGNYSNGAMKTDDTVQEGSFTFDSIPEKKTGLIPLATRFLRYKLSRQLAHEKTRVSVVTEGLGPRSFHGRVVMLVNRHTTSANEMLLAFARRYQLATIVGEATPGRVLGGSKFRLPHGYWIALPTGSYQTTDGNPIEGRPILPDVEVPFDVMAARRGRDPQLAAASEVVHRL
jgi:C-terminal processing protease CtpA/Prc